MGASFRVAASEGVLATVTGSDTGTLGHMGDIVLVEFQSGRLLARSEAGGVAPGINALALQATTRRLVVGTREGIVELWRWTDAGALSVHGRTTVLLPPEDSDAEEARSITAIALDRAGARAWVATADGFVHRVSMSEGDVDSVRDERVGAYARDTVERSGQTESARQGTVDQLVGLDADTVVCRWQNGDIVRVSNSGARWVASSEAWVAFSDGRFLVANGGKVRSWSAEGEGECEVELAGVCTCLASSHDETWAVATEHDGFSLRVWNREGAGAMARWDHGARIEVVAVDDEGDVVFSDENGMLWCLRTWRRMQGEHS